MLHRPPDLPGSRTLLHQLARQRPDEVAVRFENLELEANDAPLRQPGPVVRDWPFLRAIAHFRRIFMYSRVYSRINEARAIRGPARPQAGHLNDG